MMYVNRILVIGYGNELHGDDAAGPAVAHIAAAWQHRNLRALSRQRLTSDLVADIVRATAVVFVTSRLPDPNGNGDLLHVCDLRAHEPNCNVDLHTAGMRHNDPVSLLVHVERSTGQCPPAWVLAIAGTHFELGDPMSPRTSDGILAAIAWLKALIKHQLDRFTLEAGRPAAGRAVGSFELPA
jgi:hydrogenase maturation protease